MNSTPPRGPRGSARRRPAAGPCAQQGHRLHRGGATQLRPGGSPAAGVQVARPAGRTRDEAPRRQADRPRTLHLSDRPGGSERDLFYRTVMSDPARFIPILYDPTVAEACLTFGHVFRRARGMYITREMKGRMSEVLAQLARAGGALRLRLHGRPHPGPGRHRRQRHGHPDRQAAALHGLRRGAAEGPAARAARHRHDQRRAARRPALSRPAREAAIAPRSSTAHRRVRPARCSRSLPGLLHPLRGLEGHRRHPDAEPLQGPDPLLQRRHPGHGERGAGRPDYGAGDHRRAADRAARPVFRRRLGRDRHRRHDRLGHAGEGAVAGGRPRPHLDVRHQRPAGVRPGPTCRRRRRSTPTRRRRHAIWSRRSRRSSPRS